MAERLVRRRASLVLLGHGDFLKLWSAQTISQLGSQISLLALPLAAIIVLGASAFEVALLGTLEFLPFLLFALPAGVWVDRLARRPILVLADLGRAAALASVPVAYLLDGLAMGQLYAVAFLVGTLTIFFDVAYQSYLPSLVARDQLVEGNAKLEVSRAGAQVAGLGLGGAIVGALTAPYAILLDAASFLASALLLARISANEPHPAPASRRRLVPELWEGLRYLVGHPYWRAIAATTGTANFFNTLGFSIVLVYAVRRLHLSPELIGLVLALGSLGGLGGALVVGRLARRLGVGMTIVGSAFLFGPPLLLVPLAPTSFPLPFLVVGIVLSSFGTVSYNVTGLSLMQTLTPERLLGRLNASRRFLVWGTIPLGSLAGGTLASEIGLRPTLLAGAIGASFSFLSVALSSLRSLRSMPAPADPEGGVLAPAGLASDG